MDWIPQVCKHNNCHWLYFAGSCYSSGGIFTHWDALYNSLSPLPLSEQLLIGTHIAEYVEWKNESHCPAARGRFAWQCCCGQKQNHDFQETKDWEWEWMMVLTWRRKHAESRTEGEGVRNKYHKERCSLYRPGLTQTLSSQRTEYPLTQ